MVGLAGHGFSGWGFDKVNYLNLYIMSQVRAKFTCTGITDNPEYQSKSVSFMPVTDGSEENKSFSKYTPSGSLHLNISYETEASNAFEAGKEYYLTLEPAFE